MTRETSRPPARRSSIAGRALAALSDRPGNIRRLVLDGMPGRSRSPRERASLLATIRLGRGTQLIGPLAVAAILLLLGYRHYAPGTAYSLSGDAYRAFAFPAFRYSDIIWLYLRDNLSTQPIPYGDYLLEYPPLTGLLSYGLSFAPDLPSYFALAYLTLSACALGTVALLQRLPGANPWYVAASPALFFYTGHQWDIAAVFTTALAILAFSRGHDRRGAIVLAAAVSLKFFPLAILAAVLIERLRQRRLRATARIVCLFALVSAVINLPLALAAWDGWTFFYRWNRDRPADAGFWVLWRDLPTEQATRLSLVAALVGGAAVALVASRARRPIFLPLGATLLLWWLCVNKTFTTHLIVWVFLAMALLRPPQWLWAAVVAGDLAAFQMGNFMNLPNVTAYQHQALLAKALQYLYDPLQIARSTLLLIAVGWGISALQRRRNRLAFDASSSVDSLADSPPDPFPAPLSVGARGAGPSARRAALGRYLMAIRDRRRSPFACLRRAVRRHAWSAGVVVAYSLATVAMTWPYAGRLGSATPPGADPLLQTWLARWIAHALLTDPTRLYHANVFHPFALTLAYTDANIPGALVAAPVDLIAGNPLVTHGILVLATFVLAAGGMYALTIFLTANRGAAFLAGLAFAFLPFRYVHLWHLNWLEGAWLPWALLALLKLIERPTPRRALALALATAVLALTSFYFVLQLAILFGIVLFVALVADRRARSRAVIGHVAAALGLAALLSIPAYLPYLSVRADQGLQRTADETERYKASPSSYRSVAPWADPNPLWRRLGVVPGKNTALSTVGQIRHPDGHRHVEIVNEDALFPGGVALIGATLGVIGWRRRRGPVVALLLVALVGALLSLGPSLGPDDGSGVSLPYRTLYERLPFFAAMRVPARLGGLVGFAVVALAGLGAAWAWERLTSRLGSPPGRRRHPNALGVVLTVAVGSLLMAELWSGPIPLETVDRGDDVAAVYHWLARQQDAGAVMEFPAESVLERVADSAFVDPSGSSVRRHAGLAMLWSTEHWRPLVNGISGFVPRPHSDLLAAFSGDLRRPDGTIAAGVSHVAPSHVGLLRQLGVRYVVFHRSQYAPEDWLAVREAVHAAEVALEPAGDFGEATVYRVRPTVAPPEKTAVSLYAPTLLTPTTPWAPTLRFQRPGRDPSLLSLTELPTLTTTWYDAEGRHLWRGVGRLSLPTIMTDDRLLCSADVCEDAQDLVLPEDLPAPKDGSGWHPTEPGHYVVTLELTGDHPLTCAIDLDLVEDSAAVEDVSPDNPLRWAECDDEGRNPVNDPGRAAFRSSLPSVTFVGERIALESTLESRRDEEIRAWFLLAPPASTAPWREFRYRSPTRQRLIRAGETAAFDWLEALSPGVTPGVYDLTVWYHHRRGNGWEHAFGGDADLPSVVVGGDGTLRWAGPFHLQMAGAAPPFRAGRVTFLPLRVEGEATGTTCEPSWRLLAPDGVRVAASGRGGTCDRPQIGLPAAVPPGGYDLVVTAAAVRNGEELVSDALMIPITVRDASADGPS